MQTIKEQLSKKLIERNRFWSYNLHPHTVIPDDILIEKTLLYLDIDDINQLFVSFPYKKIKQVWRDRLVIQGAYFGRLNKLLAWMYFDIKNPEKYFKTTITQHIKKWSC